MSAPAIIAHYRITAKIGEGGMGEVWRATDTKLNRDVAIKILPLSFSADPDRLARFTREAQVLASLNHPNIASIYGVEERALILELVEGPSLADQIATRALPIADALQIARQIAEALEYAHDRGIVHRDLKPANVKLTLEGRVKVLDFGLAKALASDPVTADPASSPTLTMRATMAGLIMGTPGYMSPEQAKGRPVDRRADIWAFGVLVVEMLTGRTMYTGETVSETLASVIKDQPDLSSLPPETPPAVRRMLRRCLDKDPLRRLQAIGEARIAIDQAPAEEPPDAAASSVAAPARRGAPWWALAAAAIVPALVLVGLLWRATRPVEKPLQRFVADLGPESVRGQRLTVAISPDGRRIAHQVQTSSGTMLATRLLDQRTVTILAGTANGSAPFFSPDGQWIGYVGRGRLAKVSVNGGAPLGICTGLTRGAVWAEDGFIYARVDGQMMRIPAAGGNPEPLAGTSVAGTSVAGTSAAGTSAAGTSAAGTSGTSQEAARDDNWPQLLPGGDQLVVTTGVPGQNYDNANIGVISLKTGQYKVVQRGGSFGRYVPSGHLIFVHSNTLFAVRFDLGRLETRGTPVPVIEDVTGVPSQGAGQLDFSGNGILAYLPQGASTETADLVWMDKTGRVEKIVSTPEARTPRLSPDGKKLALSINGDVFIYDSARGSSTRITSQGATSPNYPQWMPDGKHLIYTDGGTDGGGLNWIRADGSGQAEPLLKQRSAIPQSISPDGRTVAYHIFGQGRDLYTVSLDLTDPDHPKAGKPEPFAITPRADVDPAFSPEGRWPAYASSQSTGGYQVFVRPFPPGAQGAQVQISSGPARFPLWSRTRKEIFYVAMPEGRIMVVPYTIAGGVFSPGKPEVWSETNIATTGVDMPLDISPDGKRFVVFPGREPSGAKQNVHVVFLLNFFDELQRKVP